MKHTKVHCSSGPLIHNGPLIFTIFPNDLFSFFSSNSELQKFAFENAILVTCYKRLHFFTEIKEIRISNRHSWQRVPTPSPPLINLPFLLFQILSIAPSPALFLLPCCFGLISDHATLLFCLMIYGSKLVKLW